MAVPLRGHLTVPHSPISHGSAPPLFFVMNGGSGHHNAEDTRQTVEAAMQSASRSYRIFVIEDVSQIQATVQQALDVAKEQGGVIVAVGGDGTINAVANTVLGSGCLFGAIPQGTFNYFGRTHGIPEEIDGALDDLLHGEPVPVQVGLVNDRVFLVNASVGLYPALLEDREAFKQEYGRSRLVAIWAAISTVFGGHHRQLHLTLEQDGKRVAMRTTTLFIGNNRLQLDQVGMPQAETVVQGQLAGIAVRPVGKLAMLWLGACGALGRLGDAENVIGFSFRNLIVAPRGRFRVADDATTADPKNVGKNSYRNQIKVAADGEVMWLHTPLEFRVASQPLLLIKRRHTSDAEDEQSDAAVSDKAAVDNQADRKGEFGGDAT
jgi:diacylglycerol kinase family enzyme